MTDAEGRFGFFNLSANVEYDIVAKSGDSTSRLESQTVGPDDRELVVNTHGVIAGRVTDAESGSALNRFDVRILRRQFDISPFTKVRNGSNMRWHTGGEYRFIDLSAGEVTVQVTAQGYVPMVRTLTLADGEVQQNIDFALEPLCALTLELSLDGRLLELEPVMLVFDRKVPYQGGSDALGRATLSDVAPGQYTARVVQRDGSVLTGKVVVPVQSQATVRVNLRP